MGLLKVFSGFPTVVCALLMAILCAYQAGRIALCGWLYARAANRGWPETLVFAGAFAASELLYPLLFPWYFGASVHNAPVLVQAADLGGPILVALVLVAANLAIAEIVEKFVFHKTPNRRLIVVGVTVPIIAALYGWWRISAIDRLAEQSEQIKVGIVQGNSPLKGREKALPVHLKHTAELRKKGVDLVIWSEAAIPGAFPEKGHERLMRAYVTGKLGMPAIVGGVLARPTGDERRPYIFYNSALIADQKGVVKGRYDKQFLLMFGEYLPFGDTFPILYQWSPNSGKFSPGTSLDPLVFEHQGHQHRISTTICYEAIIPSFVNKMVSHADPDLLVNLTNDAWFGDTTEPWIHLALAKLRSVEHRLYMVRVTNSGVSAVVDPVGRVVRHGGTFSEESWVAPVRFIRNRTVFSYVGNTLWWLVTALMAVCCFLRRPRRKEKT